MNNGQFAFLIRHELKLESCRRFARSWYWIYIASVAVVLFVAVAIWGEAEGFKSEYLLLFSFGLPFVFCMIAFQKLKREWTGNTLGWWLALPYPRSRLLLAKLAASFGLAVGISVLFFAGVAIVETFNLLVHGLGFGDFGRFVKLELHFLLILVVVSPLMQALGLLIAAVSKSSLRPLTPLLWITFGLFGNVLNYLNGPADIEYGEAWGLFGGSVTGWIWLAVPAVWVVAALLFAGAVNVCKKYLVL